MNDEKEMNDEQIFELAEKCGFQDDFGYWNFKDEGLLDFVFLVQNAEREACAKVCDDLAAKDKLSNYYAVAARAIRARGIDGAKVGEVGVWGEKAKPTWHCPLKKPDCNENCGSYGCGN